MIIIIIVVLNDKILTSIVVHMQAQHTHIHTTTHWHADKRAGKKAGRQAGRHPLAYTITPEFIQMLNIRTNQNDVIKMHSYVYFDSAHHHYI